MLLQQWKSVSINKKLEEKVATKNFLITNSRSVVVNINNKDNKIMYIDVRLVRMVELEQLYPSDEGIMKSP